MKDSIRAYPMLGGVVMLEVLLALVNAMLKTKEDVLEHFPECDEFRERWQSRNVMDSQDADSLTVVQYMSVIGKPSVSVEIEQASGESFNLYKGALEDLLDVPQELEPFKKNLNKYFNHTERNKVSVPQGTAC